MTETQRETVLAAILADCWTDRERRLLLYLVLAGGSVEIATVYDWKKSGMHYTNASKAAKRLMGLEVLVRTDTTITLAFDRLQGIATAFVVSTNMGFSFVNSTKVEAGFVNSTKAVESFSSKASGSKDSKESKTHTGTSSGSYRKPAVATGPARVCVSASPQKPEAEKPAPRAVSPTIADLDVRALVALGLEHEVAAAAKEWPLWSGFRVVQLQRLQATRKASPLARGLDMVGWQQARPNSRPVNNSGVYLASVIERLGAGFWPNGYELPADRAAKKAFRENAQRIERDAERSEEDAEKAADALFTSLAAKMSPEQFKSLRNQAETACRGDLAGLDVEIPEPMIRGRMRDLALAEVSGHATV